MKLVKRICKVCNKEFEGKLQSQICSDECKKENNKQKWQQYQYKKSIEKTQTIDTDIIKVCKICGYQSVILTHHLKNTHHMSKEEYCEKFNCTKDDIISKEYVKRKAHQYSQGLKEGRYKNNFQVNNPGKNHGGKFSAHSKKFIKYEGLSEEEVSKKINDVKDKQKEIFAQGDVLQSQIGYWLKQGLTEEEALLKLKERQTTFSLEKCIEKYGEEEGRKCWKQRQEKWLQSYKKQNFSKVSQNLFWKLYEKIKNKYEKIYFASLNPETKERMENRNFEYMLQTKTSFVKPDFLVLDTKKVIEFDGDYWHGKRGNIKREEKRDREILSQGFSIFHVKEYDFKVDEQTVIDNCIKFLDE